MLQVYYNCFFFHFSGSSITKYVVNYVDSVNAPSTILRKETTSTSITIQNLRPSTNYKFWIIPYGSNGAGPRSLEFTITTAAGKLDPMDDYGKDGGPGEVLLLCSFYHESLCTWLKTIVNKFAISNHTVLIFGVHALRRHLKLICEYEFHSLPNEKSVVQRIMVKTTSRSYRPWSAIFCVIVY